MTVVTVRLAYGMLTDGGAWLIALASAGVLFRYKINSAWLVLGGGVVGWLLKATVSGGS